MKKVSLWMLVIVVICALFFGALYLIDMNRIKNNKPVVFSTWGYDYVPPVTTNCDFKAKYIRTDGYNEGVEYPLIFVINTKKELDNYYDTNKERYDLERKEKVYSDTTIGFLDACDNYDEKFFDTHTLILVVIEEGSGSIRHKVTNITKNDKLRVTIDKIEPEIGTCDMAEWHIILEIEKDNNIQKNNIEIKIKNEDKNSEQQFNNYIKISDANLYAEGTSTEILVRYNGILYGKSYALIDYMKNQNGPVGKIDKLIGKEYVPAFNGETNTEELLNAIVDSAETRGIVLLCNNVYMLFNKIEETNTYNSFIGTVLEETTTYMIVEPNEDEDERKSADKIRINYGVDHIDYLYGVGRKVLITYSGDIMETYPAQINTNNIDTQGYLDFEIIPEKTEKIIKKKILNNKELYKDNSDFDLYYYGLEDVKVKVDNKTMSLEEALRSGKVTIDGIISKANKDVKQTEERYAEYEEWQSVPRLLPYSSRYKDGGSIMYYYDTYTILKKHSLDGDRDVYIGSPEAAMDDIMIKK